jgi:serine/threonine protein kinase
MSTCPNCNNPYTPGDEVCQYCGFVFPFSTDVFTPGTVLQGRYKINELGHAGGMGYVYFSNDTKLHDRKCVVKQVKEPVKSEDELRKLEEEAVEMAKLNHPNVAMIFDHFVEGLFYFLIVEYIEGKTLSQIFNERQGQLTEEEVIYWAISMCEVTGYLHKEGIVHRDISPQNIMLTNDGIIKFIDFGTLRELRDIAVGGTAGMGKFGYAPPEQWLGQPEPRSDLFAIGATIYFLLTGYLPISNEYLNGQGPQQSDFYPVFPAIREKNPKISVGLENVLFKALQLDKEQRYASSVEFGQALKSLVEIKGPVLSIDSSHLDFQKIATGRKKSKSFTLMNVGTDKLTGTLATTKPWLSVSPSSIEFEAGEQKVLATIDTGKLASGSHDTGTININTNGGEAYIDVDFVATSFMNWILSAGFAWANRMKWVILGVIIVACAAIIIPSTVLKSPALNIDSSEINFNNVRPGDISKSKELVVTNTGGGILTGTVQSDRDWLIVNLAELKLPYGEENVAIHIDAKDLPYGFSDSAVVDIDTNGGNAQIIINLTTTTIIYEDDFSNTSSGWTVSSNDIGEANYFNGQYRLSIKQPGHMIAGINPAIGSIDDFIIDFDTQSLTSSEDSSYGIIVRQKDINRFDNFYYFQIYGNKGTYKVEAQSAGQWSTLIEADAPETIKTDGSVNHVTVKCIGPKMELYINDSMIATMEDDSFLKGFVALAAMSGMESDSQVDSIFDNIKIHFPVDE